MNIKYMGMMLFVFGIAVLTIGLLSYAKGAGTLDTISSETMNHYYEIYDCCEGCYVDLGNTIYIESYTRDARVVLLKINESAAKIKVLTFNQSGTTTKDLTLNEKETFYIEEGYISLEILDVEENRIIFKTKYVEPISCEETDLGDNRFIRGTTTVSLENGKKIVKTDSCNDPKTITEHYCTESNHMKSYKLYNKDEKCLNGSINTTDGIVIESSLGRDKYKTSEYKSGDRVKIIAIISTNSSFNLSELDVELTKVDTAEIGDEILAQYQKNKQSFELGNTMEKKECMTNGTITSCKFEGYYDVPDLDVERCGYVRFNVGIKAVLGEFEEESKVWFCVMSDAKDELPQIIEYSVSPKRPVVDESFEVSMSVVDDLGLEEIRFREIKIHDVNYSYDINPLRYSSGTMLCRSKSKCEMSWNVSKSVSSRYTFAFFAEDSTGHNINKTLSFEVVDSREESCSEFNRDECNESNYCRWTDKCMCLESDELCDMPSEPVISEPMSCHHLNRDECEGNNNCKWSDECRCLEQRELCEAEAQGKVSESTLCSQLDRDECIINSDCQWSDVCKCVNIDEECLEYDENNNGSEDVETSEKEGLFGKIWFRITNFFKGWL